MPPSAEFINIPQGFIRLREKGVYNVIFEMYIQYISNYWFIYELQLPDS